MKSEKEKFMALALKEADKAEKKEEVPIGCVIVKDGKVVARAHNLKQTKRLATAHAEVLAIEKACRKLKDWRLEDYEIYVTLEPCAMCAGAILSARIPRVVYGASDQKFGACKSVCSLFDMNFNHHPQVVSGVMEEESAALLRSFFQNLRVELRSRPKWRKPGESF